VFPFLWLLVCRCYEKIFKFFCQIREKSGLFRRQNRSPSKTSIGSTAPTAKDHTGEAKFSSVVKVQRALFPAKHHTGEGMIS
jgi:hypothetical protein